MLVLATDTERQGLEARDARVALLYTTTHAPGCDLHPESIIQQDIRTEL